MRAFALLIFFMGVIAMLKPDIFEQEHNNSTTIAINYAAYRNAVFKYAYANRPFEAGASINITNNQLTFPVNWTPMREWRSRISNGRLYVYGPASPEEITFVRDFFKGSYGIGMNDNGHLIPQLGHRIDIPNFIPNGNLVSVTTID